MTRSARLASLFALTACAVESPTPDPVAPTSDDPVETTGSARGTAQKEDCGDPVDPPALAAFCATGGTLDLEVIGTGLGAYEQKTVVATAIQFDDASWSFDVFDRRAYQSTTIYSGAFILGCAGSLTETYAYPSVAAYIDVNEDGACSAGDVGTVSGYYGWDRHVSESYDAPVWLPVADPGSLTGPLHSNRDFCSGYFAP